MRGRTRPIYHSSDAAIRGYVFCSFLALVLQKELADRCQAAGVTIEWADLVRDLDRLQEATIDKDGKRITTRTPVTGQPGDRRDEAEVCFRQALNFSARAGSALSGIAHRGQPRPDPVRQRPAR